jgi:hypothetical protein
MKSWRALLLYLVLSVPFGIAVHLGSEFVGLGRDADDVVFSSIHAYLGVLAVAATAIFLIVGGFFASAAERRRRIGLMANALPFKGRGTRFFLFSAALQFGFFAITQIGEGCPMCKGDIVIGTLAAIVASLVGSFALIALRRQIVRIVTEACVARERVASGTSAQRLPRHRDITVASVYSTFAVTLGSRPPPLHS